MPLVGPRVRASSDRHDDLDDFDDGNLLLPEFAGRDRTGCGLAVSGRPRGRPTYDEASSQCVARGKCSGRPHGHHLDQHLRRHWNAVLTDQILHGRGPFDAKAYSGFSFWIATGTCGAAAVETPIGVTTADTVPAFRHLRRLRRLLRDPQAYPADATWTRWEVKFTDLAQYGFGMPLVPLEMDRWSASSSGPSQIDIWIDDLRFEP